jgi:hypothetical protein
MASCFLFTYRFALSLDLLSNVGEHPIHYRMVWLFLAEPGQRFRMLGGGWNFRRLFDELWTMFVFDHDCFC